MAKQKNYKKSEQGVALVFALLAILILSILAVGVMTATQSQTWSSLNYRETAQARYAAEAGIQQTMNWLSSTNYTVPSTFTSYTMTTNPVQYSNNPVILSAYSGVSSNYPDSTVVSAYSAAMNQTLSGIPNASFATYVTLLRMSASAGTSYISSGGASVAQTWQVTSIGTVQG